MQSQKSQELSRTSPRPLDDVLTALGAKYGWRIDYEDPRYAKDDLVDSTAASWLLEHSEGRHVYAVAGDAFNVKIPMQSGYRPDAERTIAAIVKAYESSGEFMLTLRHDAW